MHVARRYVSLSMKTAHQIKSEALDWLSIFLCELTQETNGHSFNHMILHLYIFQNIYFKVNQDWMSRGVIFI